MKPTAADERVTICRDNLLRTLLPEVTPENAAEADVIRLNTRLIREKSVKRSLLGMWRELKRRIPTRSAFGGQWPAKRAAIRKRPMST